MTNKGARRSRLRDRKGATCFGFLFNVTKGAAYVDLNNLPRLPIKLGVQEKKGKYTSILHLKPFVGNNKLHDKLPCYAISRVQ